MIKLAKRLLLLLFTAAVVLLAAEGAARLLLPPVTRGNITPVPPSLITLSTVPDVPFLLKPNAEAVHEFVTDPRGYFDPGARLTYRTNSLGFRGPDTTRDKPEGTFRIIGIGDSFTFGSGVRNEDTFLSVLQRKLDESCEVLNLGIIGYSTIHEVALLERIGVTLDPDLVVICFFLNDTGAGTTHEVFNVDLGPDELPFLQKHSRLADHIVAYMDKRTAIQELVRKYHEGFEDDWKKWIAAQEALKKARKLAAENGFNLAVMVFPILWNLDSDYPFADIHRKVSAFLQSIGVPVLDLYPAFSGYQGPDLWVHPKNQHPNEQGHALAGEALFRFLVEQGLIPQ